MGLFDKPTNIDKLEKWLNIIKNLGIVIGIPFLIVIGQKLYSVQAQAHKAQIALLEAQIEDLQQKQADVLAARLNRMQKEFELVFDQLEAEISGKDTEINNAKKAIDSLYKIDYTFGLRITTENDSLGQGKEDDF